MAPEVRTGSVHLSVAQCDSWSVAQSLNGRQNEVGVSEGIARCFNSYGGPVALRVRGAGGEAGE